MKKHFKRLWKPYETFISKRTELPPWEYCQKIKNEKVANWKLENLGTLENNIPSFLISNFSISSYSQTENSILRTRVVRWTLDAGLWTLEVGLWALDAGLWTMDSTLGTLGSGHWTLSLLNSEQNQNPVSDSAWLNYWKLFCSESLRT